MTQAQKRVSVAIPIVGVALVAIVIFLVGGGRGSTVMADDSTHTTSINLASGKVTAIMSSTDPLDAEWRIDFHITPPGGSEALHGSVETTAADGFTGANGQLDASSLASGTVIRARYYSYDSSYSTRFSYARYVTLP